MRIPVAGAAAVLSLALTGCTIATTSSPDAASGAAIKGIVHGGQQPIVGAHVYLFAANSTGYGGAGIAASSSNASISLLNGASTGFSDSIGAYVPTGAGGSFTVTGDYTCTPNSQVYLYALGGDPGSGTNSAAGLMAILGNCPATGTFAATTPLVVVNEVSTIAAAYAFAGFATDATHVSSSGTALAQIGIANAFANSANLYNLSGGPERSGDHAGGQWRRSPGPAEHVGEHPVHLRQFHWSRLDRVYHAVLQCHERQYRADRYGNSGDQYRP